MEFSASLKEHFQRLLAYDQWANDLLLKDLEALPEPDPTALGKISHILVAEELWLARLLGEDLSRFTTVFSHFSLPECREKLSLLGQKWGSYLDALRDEDYAKVIAYKNTQDAAKELAVGGILSHVFDHSTYHRGQVATAIKKAGGQPHSPGLSAFILEQSEMK